MSHSSEAEAIDRSAVHLVEKLRSTGQPIVLTINGKLEIAIRDDDCLQALLGLIDRQETIDGIQKGLEDMEAGRARPLAEVVRDKEARYGLPD